MIGLRLRQSGVGLMIPSLLALFTMYLSVIYGDVGVLGAFNAWAASLPIIAWSGILLAYCYVASVMPVWVLLQPRDFINSLQLITSLGLVVLGLVAAAHGDVSGAVAALSAAYKTDPKATQKLLERAAAAIAPT